MNCPLCHRSLLEIVEPAPQEASSPGGCPGCRDWIEGVRRVDAWMDRGLRRPELSTGFDQRLWKEVGRVREVSERHRKEARARLEAEYAAGMQRLQASRIPVGKLLDLVGAGIPLLVLAALYLVGQAEWLPALGGSGVEEIALGVLSALLLLGAALVSKKGLPSAGFI